MGGNESAARPQRREYEEAVRSFDREELERWKQRFSEISGGTPTKKKNEGFKESRLVEYTSPILSDCIQRNLMKAFLNAKPTSSGRNETENIVEWETFIVGISHILKGGLDEKVRMLALLCGSSDGFVVTKTQLTETLNGFLRSYIMAESKSLEYSTWHFSPGSHSADVSNSAVVSYFLSDLRIDAEAGVSTDLLVKWMAGHSVLTRLIEFVLYVAFHFDIKRDPEEITCIPWTIPSCAQLEHAKFRTMLTGPSLLLLSYQIPTEYRRQWKQLYSTSIYGESFSTLVKQISGKGPTIVIIQDENGHVFGGFNSKSWELSSNFLGDEASFVFSLFPTVAIYSQTGYNKNYCYMNSHQQTLPNGLGFGGQIQMNDNKPVYYFSLWLDNDFGKGTSQGACTTYNSPQLSSTNSFKIQSMEIWAVDRGHDEKKEKLGKSILDVDPQARAFLEIAGKTRASEGLRERPPSDDED